MEELLANLAQHGLIDDLGNIVLETHEDGKYLAIDIATFTSFFGSILNDINIIDKHTALIQDKNFCRFFDNWKQLGVL